MQTGSYVNASEIDREAEALKAKAERRAEVLRREAEKENHEVDELLQKVLAAKEAVREKLADWISSTEALRQYGRASHSDMAGALSLFSSTHLRLANSLAQGISRTSSVDRLVTRAKVDRLDAVRVEEARLIREVDRKISTLKKRQESLLTFPEGEEAVDELYGGSFEGIEELEAPNG